ncbi:organic solvent ABC transporter permease [Marinobacter sp. Arc7-DN-1]|uniref:organic solvent ABC transporter permease n=1 Tax=Marinobacter sp. Arc7-DN-1 TaxID=2304594 RepID=UPI000E43E886|nr:organic solvent ABC transporter permease [Marinobacter sp. Arc7-DN-1]AXS81697.1 organic solvent ABC transporter permease [Marinobacter sp. Arc7-DN-1]
MRSVHRIRLSLALLSALAFTGCLDDDSGSGDDTNAGRLNFNGFSGLSYQTASQAGTTNAAGEFRYYPGETLEFRVGDLPLSSGVPAQQYVTLLEFFETTRTTLQTPMVDEEGLTTHTLTEQQVLENTTLMNLTRFLMLLNWSENIPEGEGIELRKRVISQLNAALPNLTGPIDFTASESEFTATTPSLSPANQLLAAICFYPEDDERCEEPPSQAEIDNAPPRPEDADERDPDVEYKEDLQAKKERIDNSVRSMEDTSTEDAQTYLTRELKGISTAVAKRYYLDDDVASYPASDTAIKQVAVRRIGGGLALAELEAISTRPQDIQVHSTDWQSAEVEYFVAGPTGGESELLLSFRPENTYRWVRKQLRVIIR